MTGCVKEWIGDGYCDDFNNKAECKFDHGDCCDNTSPDWNKYCDDCENCLMWGSALNPYQCIDSWKDDTFCDDFNNHNKDGCDYDGGDCCKDLPDSDKYCIECKCQNDACNDIWKKKKCTKRKKKNKCNKEGVKKNCEKTCGVCTP